MKNPLKVIGNIVMNALTASFFIIMVFVFTIFISLPMLLTLITRNPLWLFLYIIFIVIGIYKQ